jgi:cysteine synthase
MAAADPEKYYYADQYSNDANWRAHYANGTADEIWRQTEGRVTHFVAILGTSGTFVGTSRRLKELNPKIRLHLAAARLALPRHRGNQAHGDLDHSEDLRSQHRRRGAWASKQKRPRRWPESWLGKKACWSASPRQAALVGALQIAKDAAAGSVVVTIFPTRATSI